MLTPAELVWLIAAVAKGDEAAFERLYAATRAKLFGVVLRILRRQDLAEEVIQEAYVKIWNSAGQFNPALASPITWMASIARNRAIDVVRKKSETSIEEEPAAMEVAADSPDPLARREMTEELKRLLECVGRLEPDRQKLVLLAYYNGWSREQLAAKFEAPVNTVKTWLRRSMLDIRECLGLLMAYSEDHIALAAEYALGTLDAGERVQVEAMMALDTEFTAIVRSWEYRLGALNQMVGSIEPRPIVWENIKAAIGHSAVQQAPLRASRSAANSRRPRLMWPRRSCRRRPRRPRRTSSNCRAGRRDAGATWPPSPPRWLQPWSRCWRCRSTSRSCCPMRCGPSRGSRR